METVVRHNVEQSRYELWLGETMLGHAAYRLRGDDRTVFTHTEIDPEHEGRGLGSELVAGALAGARERGLKVVPLCPFVADYIARHPELQDLLAPEHDARA